MAGKPAVSVIVPVYNVERWLPECLDSVLSQTMAEFEVLCVDDGSTDGSGAILEEYRRRDARIKVFRQRNAGAGPARNHGLDEASGEYVVFMDPDDYYPSDDVLEKLYKAVKDNACHIAGGRLRQFTDDGDGKAESWIAGDPFPRYGMVPYREYQSPYWYYCYIYSRQLIERGCLRFPAYRRFQDPPFFIKAMSAAGDFLAMEDVVYCWRTSHKKVDWDADDCRLLREHLSGALEVLRLAEINGLGRMFFKIAKQSAKLVGDGRRCSAAEDVLVDMAYLVSRTDVLPAWKKIKVAGKFMRSATLAERIKAVSRLLGRGKRADGR